MALRVLYEVEIGQTVALTALKHALEESPLSPDMADYAGRIVKGVRGNLAKIDDTLAVRVREYAYERVALVDKNVMRIATYELFEEPLVPPAVILNEAIEIAKKYSTEESGRFVNGVLASVLQVSPKANWVPPDVPDEEPEAIGAPEPAPEIEDVILEADSDEAIKMARIGGWTLRSEENK